MLKSFVSLQQENIKTSKKSVKVVNIERENLFTLWTIKFAGKIWLMIILTVTKKYGFTISLENIFLEKPQKKGGGGMGGQIVLPSRASF